MKLILFIFCVCVIGLTSIAQKKHLIQIDSLLKIVSETKNDSLKIYNTLLVSEKYSNNLEFEYAAKYAEKAVELAEKQKSKKLSAMSYNRLALSFFEKSLFKKAIPYFEKTYALYTELNNKKGISSAAINLGLCYNGTGSNDLALEYLYKSAKLKEELNDDKSLASVYLSIGNVHQTNSNYTDSYDYYKKALTIRKRTNDLSGQSSCYNNIGNIFYRLKNTDSALFYYQMSIQLKEQLNDKKRLSISYNNIGGLYHQLKKYDTALVYFKKALNNNNDINSNSGAAFTYINFAQTYLAQNKINEASDMAKKALEIAKITEGSDEIKQSYLAIAKCDSAKNDFKSAYTNFIEFYLTDKKAFNETSNKKMLELKSDHDAEKKEQQILLLNKNSEIQKAIAEKQSFELVKNKQQYLLLAKDNELKELNLSKQKNEILQKNILAENQKKSILLLNKDKNLKEIEANQKENTLQQQKKVIYLITAGSFLLLGLLALAYKGYIDKKKSNTIIVQQKTEVEHQKHLVEEKQKEIIDSINYAKRLQNAILPSFASVGQKFKDSFIFYKPKDIVAGDFYWLETSRINNPLTNNFDERTYIAAADCTGHGVPGALVSIVCSSALNRAVKEFKITDPGNILDKTRELVLETFEKSSEEVKDGMDISLLCIDNTNKKVFWSGANNPLWYIQDNELKEIKANKQSIGKTDLPEPFTTHTIDYKENSTFYLFTDGLADQFGGTKGKKYKYKQLAQLIVKNQHLSQKQQAQVISEEFENWKGLLEQVDDVCVIGVKI